jgi:hypothetical protein
MQFRRHGNPRLVFPHVTRRIGEIWYDAEHRVPLMTPERQKMGRSSVFRQLASRPSRSRFVTSLGLCELRRSASPSRELWFQGMRPRAVERPLAVLLTGRTLRRRW